MEGPQEGIVTFQYEDSDGIVTTVEKQINFNAYNNGMSDMGMIMPGYEEPPMEELPLQESSSVSWWIWVAAGVGAAVIIVVIIVIVVKNKKKEDDDED